MGAEHGPDGRIDLLLNEFEAAVEGRMNISIFNHEAKQRAAQRVALAYENIRESWNRRAGAPVSPPAEQPPNLQTERRIQGWAGMGRVGWEFAEDDGSFHPGPESIRATLILHDVAVPVGQEGER